MIIGVYYPECLKTVYTVFNYNPETFQYMIDRSALLNTRSRMYIKRFNIMIS